MFHDVLVLIPLSFLQGGRRYASHFKIEKREKLLKQRVACEQIRVG